MSLFFRSFLWIEGGFLARILSWFHHQSFWLSQYIYLKGELSLKYQYDPPLSTGGDRSQLMILE